MYTKWCSLVLPLCSHPWFRLYVYRRTSCAAAERLLQLHAMAVHTEIASFNICLDMHVAIQCCADPALPPVEQDGEFVSMTMEPARRYQTGIAKPAIRTACCGGDTTTCAGEERLPPLSSSLRGSPWKDGSGIVKASSANVPTTGRCEDRRITP